MQETRVQSLIWEDPLEKEMTIHSSILAWKIPWTEQPDRLQSECHKESDPIEHAHAHTHVHPYYPGVYFFGSQIDSLALPPPKLVHPSLPSQAFSL